MADDKAAGGAGPWVDDSEWTVLDAKQSRAASRQLDKGADNPLAQAYQAGADGLPALPGWTEAEQEAFRAGQTDRTAGHTPAGAPGRSSPPARRTGTSPAGTGGSRLVAVRHQAAGFILGAVAAALGLAYLEHGPAGVKSWISAKFWNAPSLNEGSSVASSGNSSGSGGTVTVPPGANPANYLNPRTLEPEAPNPAPLWSPQNFPE